MDEAACAAACQAGGWPHYYFIPNEASGCTTITDDQGPESLPWEDAPGDTVWRYLVCVGCAPHSNPPPHSDPPESWCELGSNEECWERHILYRCKILWPEDT
ncbi:MAG: hypothetical protein V1784_07895 [bacterium]